MVGNIWPLICGFPVLNDQLHFLYGAARNTHLMDKLLFQVFTKTQHAIIVVSDWSNKFHMFISLAREVNFTWVFLFIIKVKTLLEVFIRKHDNLQRI